MNSATRSRCRDAGSSAPFRALLVTLFVLAGCSFGSSTPPASEGQAPASTADMVVSAEGSGNDCTDADPCDLVSAVAKAPPGSVIAVQPGDYPSTTLLERSVVGDDTRPVRITAADDEQPPVFDGIETNVPYMTFEGISSTSTWWIQPGADHTTLDGITIDGSGLFLRSHDVVVRNSTLANGFTTDGIQVGRAKDVLIENNTIRDYRQNKGDALHSDCIQVFDATQVTIRANRLRNCYNAGIILSAGENRPMHDIVIESNFVQGCIVVDPTCGGGSAADLRSTIDGLVVRSNTFADGSFRILPGQQGIFDRNIVGFMSECESPLTNSIVLSWNVGACPQPGALTRGNNRSRTLTFVDNTKGDLRPKDADDAKLSGASPGTRTQSINGEELEPDVAGAWQEP